MEFIESTAPEANQSMQEDTEREWKRLDNQPNLNEILKDNALHDTLMGEGKVEVYEVFGNQHEQAIRCNIQLGRSINGHPGIVHGGITALLFDNSFGWLYVSLGLPPAFTANLNINYRNPVYANTSAVLYAQLELIEGRKLHFRGRLTSVADGQLLAEATALFIQMRRSSSEPVKEA